MLPNLGQIERNRICKYYSFRKRNLLSFIRDSQVNVYVTILTFCHNFLLFFFSMTVTSVYQLNVCIFKQPIYIQ